VKITIFWNVTTSSPVEDQPRLARTYCVHFQDRKACQFAALFFLILYLAYRSILKIVTVRSSETSVKFYLNTQRYIPKDSKYS
jgi:hypothetical protein